MKKVVYITYFVHGTTIDNENHIATGWSPGELSELGKKQSIELKDQIGDKKFDAVFCSDLKRAVDSAQLTFEDAGIEIIQDNRLRECDYGDFTRRNSREMNAQTLQRVNGPFPNGESYKDVERRIKNFLDDLLEKYEGKHIAIVAHKAPQLALDVIIKGKTWEQRPLKKTGASRNQRHGSLAGIMCLRNNKTLIRQPKKEEKTSKVVWSKMISYHYPTDFLSSIIVKFLVYKKSDIGSIKAQAL